jgi:branched-subunit amino acid aminotransferase/4-amino-4-deoxychorismate lyase
MIRPNPERGLPQPKIALLGGRWVPHDELRIPIDDLGFRQGATAVERLRTYRGQIFHPQPHLDRWLRSVEAVGIEGLPLATAIAVLMDELIGRNREFAGESGDFGITMFATPGRSAQSGPTFCMHLNPIDHATVARRRSDGQQLVVTNVAQPAADCWPREIKVRCRLHYYLADQIARQQHPDALALLVDPDDTITDTSIANIAIVQDGAVIAPPRDRVLGGITQRVVEQLAREQSIRWVHQPVAPDRLRSADEVLLMGTDGGLWFANRVDRKTIGRGRPGRIFRRLLERFDQLTLG